MSNFIWLASYPKSGNTWLRAFIYYLIERPNKSVSLDAITRYFESEANPKYYQRFLAQSVSQANFDELIALRPKVQQDIRGTQTHGSIFVKTHSPLRILDATPLHDLSATAAAIYIVRNPLDVVVSVASHFDLSFDDSIDFINNPNTATVTDEQSVATFLGGWSEHVQSWTRSESSQFLVLRYEDMLDKPLPAFAQVAKLLGLEINRKELRQVIDMSSFENLQRSEDRGGFAEKPVQAQRFFRSGAKNQWIKQLSEEQILRVIATHKEQMLRFGYVPPKFR